MDQQELARAVQRYAAAKEAHDLDATIEMYSTDGTYQSVGFGPVVSGHEQLRQFFGGLFTALPDYHGDFDGVSYGENVATVWGRWGGTYAADFLGLGVEIGNRIEIPVVFYCEFRNGLLVKEVGYFDTAEFCVQSGIPLSAARPDSDRLLTPA